MLDGELTIINEDGSESVSKLLKGISYFRNKGLNHNVINRNNFEYRFMRHMFVKDSISMTMNGKPAIKNNKNIKKTINDPNAKPRPYSFFVLLALVNFVLISIYITQVVIRFTKKMGSFFWSMMNLGIT